MDSDTDDYPRRMWNQHERDKCVALLIDRLIEHERKTDPKNGTQSAKGKDLAAFSALKIAGQLVSALAGWALDHQAGLALEGLEFVPLGTVKTSQRPDYLTSRSMVDDHRHERNGFDMGDSPDPIVARRWLVNLLRANPGGFDLRLQQFAISDLKAGDWQATEQDRKVTPTILNMWLRAISFVEYRKARGFKKYKAQQEVAEALGVSDSTLRTWEVQLRKELGQLAVSRALSFAENYGSRGRAGEWDVLYGPVALQRFAQQFKAVKAAMAGK